MGNYGKQYENTRHNIGFMAAERLIDKRDLRCNRLRFRALTEVIEFGGANVLLMMPQTYMNLSGEAVGEAARFYKIPADHVIVISDDISLPLGKLRVRGSGSAGGHNGLKNIIAHLGTDASRASRSVSAHRSTTLSTGSSARSRPMSARSSTVCSTARSARRSASSPTA